MNHADNRVQYIEEDTIDLKELWQTIAQGKSIVLGIIFVVTLASLIYVSLLKPVPPLYEASALVEIGEDVGGQSDVARPLDDPKDLKNIINRVMDIDVVVPKRTNTLLLLSATNTKEDNAKSELQRGIDFIMKRHQNMASDYTKVRMSQVIGEVKVADVAKQPKKKLIVAVSFVSSLIFALFLVFFLEFIRDGKKEEV